MERIKSQRLSMIVNGCTEDPTSELTLARQALTAEHVIREIQAKRLRWVPDRWVVVKYAGRPSEEWSEPQGMIAEYLNALDAEADEAADEIASWFAK